MHAAGASARGHRAARLLRAAEGLYRSAAALLQLPDDATTSKGKAKEGDQEGKPKKKEQPKQSEEDKALDMDEEQKTPGARRRRRRRRNAPAAELLPTENKDVDFDDRWAVEASEPPTSRLQSSAAANLPATAASAETRPPSPTLPSTEEGLGKPGATRITDGPSSARGGVTGEAAAASAKTPPALLAGDFACAQNLHSRPELNGEFFQLERHDRTADRWVCHSGSGKQFRLRPANLAPLRDGLHAQPGSTQTSRRRPPGPMPYPLGLGAACLSLLSACWFAVRMFCLLSGLAGLLAMVCARLSMGCAPITLWPSG